MSSMANRTLALIIVRYDNMKKNDFYLLGGIVLFIAIVFLFMHITKKEGSKVVITIDGREDRTFYINENTTYKIMHENGEWNTLEIKDGHVRMIDASCPDKLCVKHRAISYDNESITCLPNRVVLRVIGGEENELDAIAN